MPEDGMPFISKTDDGWHITVRVQPGAKKSEVAGITEGMLRIRLSAPAVDNKANQALIEFIAKKLEIKKNKVRLASGEKSRQKKLFITADAAPSWTALLEGYDTNAAKN